MCQEHPFHSLYQVYCLNPDQPKPGTRRHSGRHSTPPIQNERAAAAADIFDKLKQEEPSAKRVKDVEILCSACVEWAMYPLKDNRLYKVQTTQFNVPDVHLRRLKDIKVPVMTCHLPIDPTMRYEDCVWINRYETRFSLIGGINMPKVIDCMGTDGRKYKQLVRCQNAFRLSQTECVLQV